MSFNNGNERRKLNAKWEQLRVQYREAGMSEEAEFQDSGFDIEDAPEDAGADIDVDFDDE